MKYVLGAFALAIATPAAAQPAAQPSGHGDHGHRGHGQHGQQGHGQHSSHGQGGHGEHGRHQDGQRHGCPCCAPGSDGRRPACCENMQQQSGERQQGHGNH